MNRVESTPLADAPADPLALEALLRDVLAIVSHDLRTPLSVVHTTTSMLLNPKYQLTPQQVGEQYERIRRNVDLMNRMIGDLTDMTAIRTGRFSIDPQPLLINDVLNEAVTAQQAPARHKGVELSFNGSVESLKVDGDRARLVQLFQNLLGHCVNGCKSGDRIDVHCRASGQSVQIEIADSGPGIAADELAHIFDPYYSVNGKNRVAVAGLGLYIGKSIVDAHGGQIRCGSLTGAGTTFSVSLPLTS